MYKKFQTTTAVKSQTNSVELSIVLLHPEGTSKNPDIFDSIQKFWCSSDLPNSNYN